MSGPHRNPGDPVSRTSFPYGLTPREFEVISCICQGMANRDIGRMFGCSHETVKRHLSNIFDKTGQSSRLELALFAGAKGLASTRPLESDVKQLLDEIESMKAVVAEQFERMRMLAVKLINRQGESR